MTIFDLLDFITTNVLLPLGGLFTAAFVGWVLPRSVVDEQLRFTGAMRVVWQVLVRVVAPLGVLTIFVVTLCNAILGG